MLKSHTPLLIPLTALIAGILVGSENDIDLFYLSVFISVMIFTYITIIRNSWKSITIPFLFFFLGVFSFHINYTIESPHHFSNKKGSKMTVKVLNKERTSKGYRYFVNVKSISNSESLVTTTGKLMIYSDSLIMLKQFEEYELPFYFKKIETYENPGLFDYGTYLANQNIYHQSYIKDIPSHIKTKASIQKWIRNKREIISDTFQKHLPKTSTQEIVKTLLLGEKKDLDRETKTIFINNGLAHLLAISGMHVGIVLIILNFVFGRITISSIKYPLIILGIWFYILLSGMQIPAIRAGFMFSLMVVGQMSNRNIKVLNSILFAAMVMLSINPLMLFQLSFQLSFTAMASILLFYQKIYHLFSFKHQLTVKIWQLVALNLSVQILVLPLSLYYFNQLPVYSIIASMISIPFMILIMWGSIILLITSNISLIISSLLSYALDFIIDIYMTILNFFSGLPNALIQDINIHVAQVIFWVVAIIGFTLFYFKNSRKLTMACACFIPFILSSSFLVIDQKITSKLTIYDEPHQIIIDIQSGNDKIRFMEEPDRKSYQVPVLKDNTPQPLKPNAIINWNDYSIAILDQVPSRIIKFDLCIINKVVVLEEELPCNEIVIPRKIRDTSRKNNFYKIANNGSYNLKLYQ